MRRFVLEPMDFAGPVPAGDAAHIVPPTAATGMNLTLATAKDLAAAPIARLREDDHGPLTPGAHRDTSGGHRSSPL